MDDDIIYVEELEYDHISAMPDKPMGYFVST